MATIILKAVEILTDDGQGLVVPGPLAQVGLATDGHIVLITGRPNIVSVTGDTTRTDWVSGILAKDPSAFQPSEHADFIEAGCFSELGDMEFAVKNTQAYIETCEANAIFLGHRTVIHYHVTSSDGITFHFERRWTGIIEEVPYTKLQTTFKCINNALDIFKSTPNQMVTKDAYPNAPSDSLDKPIPIALGYVPFSPMLTVRGGGNKTVLMKDGATEYMFCSSVAYDKPNRTLTLLTGFPVSPEVHTGLPGMQFAANDNRLVDHYLHVAIGNDQKIRIIGNDASSQAPITITVLSFTFNFYPWTTKIYLADELDEAGGLWVRYGLFGVDSASWYFEVLDLANTLIASTKPVFEIAPLLAKWNSDAKAFNDVSEVLNLTSTTNIDAGGHPGASVHANKAESNGGFANYQPIPPQKIVVVSKLNWGASDLPDAGSEAPLLIDRSDSTYYSATPSAGTFIVVLDAYLPTGLSEKDYSEFAILYDYSGLSTGTDQDFILYATVEAQDIYGEFYTFPAINEAEVESYAAIDGVVGNVNGLPRKYINSAGSDSHFYALKGALAIQDLLSDSKRGSVYNRIRLTLKFQVLYPSQFSLKLMEIGFVGKILVNASSEPLHTHIRGEVAGTTWDDRIDPSDHLIALPQGIEHLVRNYDTRWPVWQGGKTYAQGERVRGTADTGHIFVCTVAGTSSGTEPTWTDTTGATYTDGAVTWKEWREIPIDTASFNVATLARLGWFFVISLKYVKSTLDWVKDACEKGMLIGMVDRYGRVKIKPWRELNTPLYAFTYGAGGNILEGTFEDMPMSDISRIYNDILIRYDWNYAAGKFNQQLFITKIDDPQFPGPSETVVTGTSLGAFSVTGTMDGFVIGLTFTTTLPHGLSNGDFVSLSGSADGFNFDPASVGVIDTTHFVVIATSGGWLANPSTSGTLIKNPVSRLKWKDYVGGIINYGKAKQLWDKAHASYKVTGVVQKLPEKLGDCKWFIDPYAQFNGKYIWSDDGGVTQYLAAGDDHPAVYYAEALLDWNPWPKKMPEFEVADEPAVSLYEIGDCVSVMHPKLTQGVTKTGWIFDKAPLPRDDDAKKPERFRYGVMLKPDQMVDALIIEEHGATDSIDEHGATDIYEEHGA